MKCKVGDRVLYCPAGSRNEHTVTIVEDDGSSVPYRFEPLVGAVCWAYESDIRAILDSPSAPAPPAEVGKKFDAGKPRPGLIPGAVLLAIGRVLAYGAAKYGANNWQHVLGARERYTDALLRHLAAWTGGEARDEESGMLHLEHVATNAVFLLYFELTGKWPEAEK